MKTRGNYAAVERVQEAHYTECTRQFFQKVERLYIEYGTNSCASTLQWLSTRTLAVTEPFSGFGTFYYRVEHEKKLRAYTDEMTWTYTLEAAPSHILINGYKYAVVKEDWGGELVTCKSRVGATDRELMKDLINLWETQIRPQYPYKYPSHEPYY